MIPEFNILAATLIHINIMQLSQTIDCLVISKAEVLLYAVLALLAHPCELPDGSSYQ